jgi:Ser/Thr protein kinase RdoA (MazF antagonist)
VSGVTGISAPTGLVHGMGKELVEPDWSPLTSTEVRTALARYPQPGVRLLVPAAPGGIPATPGGIPGAPGGIPGASLDGIPGPPAGPFAGDEMITWRSPRPMSAAALVRRGGADLFVKRHHVRVRTPAQLAVEHAFIGHLRARGIPAPAVLRTADGATATQHGDFVYEVHEVAGGLDLYRDAVSWTPYASLGHARAAGAALARLHLAADRFPLPARSPAVLTSGCELIVAADPLAEVKWLAGRRPGLAAYLDGRAWPDDLARHVLPAIRRAAPLLAGLPRQWGHGDWHPSNLTWTSAGPDAVMAGVFDFGLASPTFAVHDLATALERATVSWLDLTDLGRAEADLDAIDALLDGYESVRPLTPAEAAALPEVFPVVHVEYALSEVEYFAHVVSSPANADLAYDGYLLGHAAWFETSDGAAVLDHLRRRAATA